MAPDDDNLHISISRPTLDEFRGGLVARVGAVLKGSIRLRYHLRLEHGGLLALTPKGGLPPAGGPSSAQHTPPAEAVEEHEVIERTVVAFFREQMEAASLMHTKAMHEGKPWPPPMPPADWMRTSNWEC